MSEKEKLPFWLGVVLGMILGMSAVLLVVLPQLDRTVPASHVVKLHGDSLLNLAEMNKTKAEQTEISHLGKGPAERPQAEVKQLDLYLPESTQGHVNLSLSKGQRDDSLMQPEAMQGQATIASEAVIIAEKKHGIALVIDDAGYDLSAVERLLALSVPIAVSILPESTFAHQSAVLTKQAGQVVMLHLPMQPEDPSLQMTEEFLRGKMEKQALRDTFLRDLEKVPFVEGVNNHMGSMLTKLEKPMQWVMQLCQEKKLFFVDSRTTAQSVAATTAQSMGLAWASRSIFLDHEMTLEAMKHAWQRARNCAKKKLSCVVIAHPRAKTVIFLENYLTKEDAKSMVSIRHLLQRTPLITQAARTILP